ncbi:MAG: hypothetical protein Q4E65_01245 [Clostridia bacterium]|nr:hypothetical protein [Clostridia bacterium]
MKPSSPWDKLVLLLLALLSAGAGVWGVCLSVGVTGTGVPIRMLTAADQSVLSALPFGVVGILLIVAAIWVIWAFLLRRGSHAEGSASVTIRKGENGSLQISAVALDTMVRQYCKSKPAVLSCDTEVTPRESGASLLLRTALSPDADIPAAIAELQEGLSGYLEKMCGLAVTGIDVLIVPPHEQKNG